MTLSRTAKAAFAALLFAGGSAAAQNPAPPGYQYEIRDGALELHFHGMAFRDAHDDENQNEVGIDFARPVDSAVFDRLAGELPNWIALAFSDSDTAVIRAARPIAFTARAEPDGFSLRLAPRAAGPAPLPLRGQYGDTENGRFMPPPADNGASLRPAYGPGDTRTARAYYSAALALHPGDPSLRLAYDRAGGGSPSAWSIGGTWRQFPGSTLYAGDVKVSLALGGGLKLVGGLDTVSAKANHARAPDGSFSVIDRSVRSGSAGVGFNLGGGAMTSAELLYGNDVLGGRIRGYADTPNGYWDATLTYREPYLETAEALADHATRDGMNLALAQNLGDGLWAGGAIFANRYGIHGDAGAAQTLGWKADLRYTRNFQGLVGGLGYDGLGEYVIAADKFSGAAPSPYVPLSIRTREIHIATASLSADLPDAFALDVYSGFAIDRYANDGLIAGGAVHFRPLADFDLAFNLRYSNVALTQGEKGAETVAGLSLNIGFGGVPAAQR